MRWMPHSVRRSRTKSLTSLAMSILSIPREQRSRGGSQAGRCCNRPAAAVELGEQAFRLRLVVEDPVRAEVARDRLEQVSVARAVEQLVGLLRVVAAPGEVAVEEPGRDLLAVDRLDRWPGDDELSTFVRGREEDGLGRDLRLEDRRDRLRVPRHLR